VPASPAYWLLRRLLVASVLGRTASKLAVRVAHARLLAQIGAGALAGWGAFGCGKTLDAAAPSAEGTPPRGVQPDDYTSACAATCKAQEPAAVPGYEEQQWWCATASVSDCTSQCAQALDDVDEPCAKCTLDQMSWLPAMATCNERECVCFGGSPSFAGLPCQDACASTWTRHKAEQAAERLAQPEPEPIGHMPARTIALGARSISALSATDRHGLWAVGSNEARQPVLSLITLDGQVLAEGPLPDNVRRKFAIYTSAIGVLLIGDEGVGGRATVARFDRQAQLLWTTTVGDDPRFIAVSDTFGGDLDLGSAAFAVRAGDDIAYFDESGSPVDSVPAPARSIAPFPNWASYALDPRGGLFMAESGNASHDLGIVRHFGAPWPASAEPDFRVQFSGNDQGGSVTTLRADTAGGAYVLGTLLTVRGGLNFGDPFVGHINAQGSVDYAWTGDQLVTGWGLPEVVWNEAGELYLLTTEDPIEHAYPDDFDTTGICSAWGCRAFVLHKLSPDGSELWRYEHRKFSDHGGISLSTTGAVIVSAGEGREENTALLLVFSPD
jgi:hypothetical protein